jgi:hypothetical protein
VGSQGYPTPVHGAAELVLESPDVLETMSILSRNLPHLVRDICHDAAAAVQSNVLDIVPLFVSRRPKQRSNLVPSTRVIVPLRRRTSFQKIRKAALPIESLLVRRIYHSAHRVGYFPRHI